MNKSEIRKNIIIKRKNMRIGDALEKSKAIFNRLISTDFLKYSNFLLYADFKNEVQTGNITEFLLKNGKNVYLPVCNTENNTFRACKIHSTDFDSITNCYGICEPTEQSNATDEIDCAIVPGVAFNEYGVRIGFGGGYYDRFFETEKNLFKIGLCYEYQICCFTEYEKHDVPMDLLITEKRVIVCGSNCKKGS